MPEALAAVFPGTTLQTCIVNEFADGPWGEKLLMTSMA